MNRTIICLTVVISLTVVGYLIYHKVINATIDQPIIKKLPRALNLNSKTIIIIGSGLAGLTASLTVAEQGHEVILLEKDMTIGGNSIKASSGINSSETLHQKTMGIKDSHAILEKDTLLSAGDQSNFLIHTLSKNSSKAIQWLESYGIKMTDVFIMGGHTVPRTHKVLGYTLIKTLEKEIRAHPNIHLLLGARFTDYIMGINNKITGVIYNDNQRLFCNAVIVATGGFGANHEMITKYRPDLLGTTWTTNTAGSIGDGIDINKKLGASLMDMDKIQLHPTGFIDPKNPKSISKILAPEILRGKGGLLFSTTGYRFCNELDRRDNIVNTMHQTGSTVFFIILTQIMINQIDNSNFYVEKGLLKKMENINELSHYMKVDKKIITEELKQYMKDSLYGTDVHGKNTFPNTPINLTGIFYIGIVSPVLHYCMGGLKIDGKARVIDVSNNPLPYIFAAGEVTGGIHRNNRLGGNSLLDCVVFGRIAGLSAVKYGSDKNVIMDIKKNY